MENSNYWILIQFIFASAALKWSVGKYILSRISLGVQSVIDYAKEGISFIFGSLSNDGSIFAVNVLGVIIFISALVSVLYYLGVMQFVIKLIGGGLSKLLGTSKLETISSAANIFLGQTEAPLLIKPYVEKLTESELFTVMVGGLASVSGSILVGYSLLGIPIEYLVSASFMSAPAGLIISKIIIPEIREAKVNEEIEMVKDDSSNIVDAASKGAIDGLGLVLNIAAILLAFVALIALINGIIGLIGGLFGIDNLSLQSILGYIFAPIATIIGVPMKESVIAGSLIGQKIILNEKDKLMDICKETIKQNGYNYDVSINLGYSKFPTKQYSSVVLPAGEYKSLKIIIGKGQGKNWWCVMFPPLCFVDEQNNVIDKETDEKLKKVLTKDEYELIVEKDKKNINNLQIKFKIVEVFQKILNLEKEDKISINN